MSKVSTIVAALVFSMPLVSMAQNAPQGVVIAATAPGQAGVSEAVQLQGKVKSINKKDKSIVVVGSGGNEIVMALGEEAKNFNQIRVGDLVTLTYIQALALELRKLDNKAAPSVIESQQANRAKPGEKPSGEMERTVRVIADVVATNPKAKTVTLRGPKRTVELAVNDPEQFKLIKVGDQVEATYTEALAIDVTTAKKK